MNHYEYHTLHNNYINTLNSEFYEYPLIDIVTCRVLLYKKLTNTYLYSYIGIFV